MYPCLSRVVLEEYVNFRSNSTKRRYYKGGGGQHIVYAVDVLCKTHILNFQMIVLQIGKLSSGKMRLHILVYYFLIILHIVKHRTFIELQMK